MLQLSVEWFVYNILKLSEGSKLAGFPLGTALAFMMAVSALSLPEAIMLRRAMRLNLIALFFGITTLAIIFTGYLFNLLQKILV